ncbi:MAG TPA: dTMP kinase [Candidatus Limiplasma sp.]|nr:dTMP kinase [Candidatus Limiplasma sp.]
MHNLPYDAVLFDIDGTLTRSEDGILSSLRYALTRMHLPVPPDDTLKQFIGPPLREAFKQLLGFTDAQMDEAIQYYVAHYDREGIYRYSIFPHIRPLLTQLKKNGAYLAVATSKPIERTIRLFEYFHMYRYFDCVIGEKCNEVQAGKPELIRRALPKTYRRAVMIGDRKYDIEGAKANGIDSIGVRYGYSLPNELEQAGATYIAEKQEDLFTMLCPDCKPGRGYFLTMEGLDGSGKTTQIEKLAKSLTAFGYDIVKTREPGGCKISEDIRHLILTTENMEMSASCEALLYAASRAQHVHQVIRPAVEAGKLVLCDRFVDSSIAYQGGGRQLGVDEVAQINAFAVGNMVPDASIYLQMDHQQALARRKQASKLDRLEIQPPAFHERTQKVYEQLMRDHANRFIAVDGNKPVDELADDILQAVIKRLEAAEGI